MPAGERMFVQWIADHLQRDAQFVDRLREVVVGSGLWPSVLERSNRSDSVR